MFDVDGGPCSTEMGRKAYTSDCRNIYGASDADGVIAIEVDPPL